MDKVKILVVEDEIIIADNICDILEELGYEVLEPAISYTEALERLKEEKPDLALLDIQLAGRRDGIDLAWRIKDDYNIPFIFLTSNADPATVERAKKVSPPAYLLKPFDKNDLFTSIEIALYNYSQNRMAEIDNSNKVVEEEQEGEDILFQDTLFVKHKQVFQKVNLANILFLKSEHVYVKIKVSDNKEYLVRASLSKFAEKLPAYFFKIHRSYVVNLKFVDSVGFANLIVAGVELPFGKGYRAALLEKLDILN